MPFVYVVIENSDNQAEGGGVCQQTFNTFEEARLFVISKYEDELTHERDEVGDGQMASEVDVVESKSGFTTLYIEKGIKIYIHKLYSKP